MTHRWPWFAVLLLASVVAVASAQTPAPAAAPSPTIVSGFDQQPPPPPPPVPKPATAPKATATPAPPDPSAPPAAPAAPERRRAPSQLVNVKIELTITDQVGDNQPQKKNIVMVVADGESGRVRTTSYSHYRIPSASNVLTRLMPLNFDAAPEVEGNRIRLRLSLDYESIDEPPSSDLPVGTSKVQQSISSVVADGVPIIISQTADPVSARKVTLEVKASILK